MILDQIKDNALQCRNCSLCNTRINVVFGSGNPNADIMLVGEAPGRNEDESGMPFVGAAGRVLDDMLIASGLDRAEIYIANIVKCRPPQNRDPRPDEEEACIHFLNEQIEAINPRIIVCLGRIAAQQLISPDFSVTKQHGQVFIHGDKLIMGTFHPAALLRNPSNKIPTFHDFEKLCSITKHGADPFA